jgi:hypothetical protein
MKKIITFLFVLLMTAASVYAVDLTVTGGFPANVWNNNSPDYKMAEIGTTGIYMLEKTLPAGTYEFKVFYSGTWNGASSGDNRVIVLDAEKTVKFYAKDDAGTIRFYADAQQIYVIGAAVGGWTAGNMKLMTNAASDASYTADVVAGDYKIVVKDKNNNIVWNDITPNNKNVPGTGNFTLKLDFATFVVTTTANNEPEPSLSSLSDSYIFVGADPAAATWYNANATFQTENFHNKNLGSVTAPIFLGGEIKTAPVLEGTVTVKMFYQIDDLTVNELVLPFNETASGKSKWKSTAGTNVFTGASLVNGNTYSLKVWFNATDGTSTLWDSNNMANYVASFIYDVGTSVAGQSSVVNRIYTRENTISADLKGAANVQLFNIAGQLLQNQQVDDKFEMHVKSGVYILKIDGESFKVVVK